MSVLDPSQAVFEQAARGHRSMLFAQGLKLACKLASVLVLARLVTPNDHGLFAMASSVILLLALFRDAGLGAAAVQARSLDSAQLNALFWCHLCIGVLLTLLTLVAAPLTARFYATPPVTPLLMTTSVAFLLIGAGGFARSQLERASRFGEVSWIESAAAIIGTLAMIGAALAGAGAYAFAVYLLVSEALATTLAWRVLTWKPRGTPQWSSVRGLLRIGAELTSYQVIVYFLQQIDAIIVGRFFGAHALGLYNRSNQLLALPNLYVATPLNQVALVTLSRLGSDSHQFAPHARTTATVIAHLILPLFAICIMLPEETILLVLGAQWPEAAPLLRLLSIAAAASTITSLSYSINVAAGQTRRLVLSAIFALPITIAAVWFGAQRGPIGVAESIAAVNVSLLLPRLWWTLRDLPGGLSDYLRALTGPVFTSAAAMLGLWLGKMSVENSAWSIRLSVAGASGGVGIILLAILWPRVRKEWQTVIGYLPLPRRRQSNDVV